MSISRYWGPDLSSAGRYLGSESDCRSVARSGDAQHPAGASPSGLRDRHVRHLHPDVRDCGGAALRRALRILFGEQWWLGYCALGTVRCKERPAVFLLYVSVCQQICHPPSQDTMSGLHYTVSTQAQCSNNATAGGESIPGVELQVWGSCCNSVNIHILATPCF